MKTLAIAGLAAMAILMVLALLNSPVAAWHGTGGPTGSGTAALGTVPFSIPIALHPDNGYRTCVIGNFPALDPAYVPPDVPPPVPPNQGHAMEHHWKVLSRGPTAADDGSHSVDVVIGAFAVNGSEERGKVRATAVDATETKFIEVFHPTITGQTAFGTLALDVVDGVPYDITIENTGTDTTKRVAHHYIIGADQRYVELGYGHPTLEYLEGGRQRWVINAAAGETITVTISVDDSSGTPSSPPPPGVPPQATAVAFLVRDPSAPPGVFVLPPSASTVDPGSPISVTFPTAPNLPTTYVFAVNANGHFKLDKAPGPDHGLYAVDCPPAPGPPPLRVSIDIKPGSDPSCFNNDGRGTIPVAIPSRPPAPGDPGFDATQVDPASVGLAGLGVKVVGKSEKLLANIEDVNGDGLDNLVVKIQDADGAFEVGTGTAILSGQLFGESGGNRFAGLGDICITQ